MFNFNCSQLIQLNILNTNTFRVTQRGKVVINALEVIMATL